MQGTEYRASTQELENCAKEVIHLTPLIQPHGLLLACDCESGCIEFASDNVEAYFGAAAQQMLGTPLADYVNEAAEPLMLRLRALPVASPVIVDIALRITAGSAKRFEVAAHRSGHRVIIEATPFVGDEDEGGGSAQIESVVAGLGRLHHEKALPLFLDHCAGQIRELCGYQRVIVYRFLPDWSGEVLAESVSSGIDIRFLGLRFPASDIPVQARALYRTNLLRVIGDVNAEPVPVQALQTDAALDQSHGILRSPSPMHLGYLRNMGVRATLTISLLKDGELWGMVSCHHDQPRTPPAQVRWSVKMLCALVAESAIVRIEGIEQNEVALSSLTLRNGLTRLAADTTGPGEIDSVFNQTMAELLPVLGAQDYGLMLGGKLIRAPGITPELLAFFERKALALPAGEGYFTHCITADPQCPIDAVGHWAGASLMPLPGNPKSFLLLLREEVTHQVRWAGAPSSSTKILDSGLRVMGPRQSFEQWIQEVRGQSVAWSDYDKSAGFEVAKQLAEGTARRDAQLMRAELYLLGTCMARLNDMVVITNATGLDETGPSIVYVNDAFIAGTGYTREEAIGSSLGLLLGALAEHSAQDAIRAAVRECKPVDFELSAPIQY